MKTKSMNDYFKDIDEWESDFMCSECSSCEKRDFGHIRTVANGEVWICNCCKTEIMVSHQPNEDKY